MRFAVFKGSKQVSAVLMNYASAVAMYCQITKEHGVALGLVIKAIA